MRRQSTESRPCTAPRAAASSIQPSPPPSSPASAPSPAWGRSVRRARGIRSPAHPPDPVQRRTAARDRRRHFRQLRCGDRFARVRPAAAGGEDLLRRRRQVDRHLAQLWALRRGGRQPAARRWLARQGLHRHQDRRRQPPGRRSAVGRIAAPAAHGQGRTAPGPQSARLADPAGLCARAQGAGQDEVCRRHPLHRCRPAGTREDPARREAGLHPDPLLGQFDRSGADGVAAGAGQGRGGDHQPRVRRRQAVRHGQGRAVARVGRRGGRDLLGADVPEVRDQPPGGDGGDPGHRQARAPARPAQGRPRAVAVGGAAAGPRPAVRGRRRPG